jgi:hypothetical protein
MQLNELASDRPQRLRTLENEIRQNYEAFVTTGFALMEIRDDELYKEDGFPTWDRYLKERVGRDFGIEERQVYNLIACAQIRTKIPEVSGSALPEEGWSQKAILEFARLAPKSEAHEQRRDFDKLDKRDVARVAKKAAEMAEKEGDGKPTASIVRKVVDEELGVKLGKPKSKPGDEGIELGLYLYSLCGRMSEAREALRDIPADAWQLLSEDWPQSIQRVLSECEALIKLLGPYRGPTGKSL